MSNNSANLYNFLKLLQLNNVYSRFIHKFCSSNTIICTFFYVFRRRNFVTPFFYFMRGGVAGRAAYDWILRKPSKEARLRMTKTFDNRLIGGLLQFFALRNYAAISIIITDRTKATTDIIALYLPFKLRKSVIKNRPT